MTNIKTIARNTGWNSLENIINAVVLLFSSIAINRYLGPDKNSDLIYVSWIAGMVSGLGGLGIPATTRKYMAEFIGMGDRGTARFIYWRTLAIQTTLATLATGSLLLWVIQSATGDYKLASALIVISIWPAMVNSISSQANAAAEDFYSNVPASICSASTYFLLIFATVFLKWGVIGVGVALLSMRGVDFLVRAYPTMKRVLAWETTQSLPPGVSRRMIRYAWQSIASIAVAMVVWGRSEVWLLKHLNADKSQVSFYSVAFTMAEQLLLFATIFGTAAGATIFAQFGRDKSKLPELAGNTFRYIAMMSIPVHFIAASLAYPALLVVYGDKYVGAAMVVTLAPVLCMFKAFVMPAQNLLESMERQRYVIGATSIAGIIDIGVAAYLIPMHGAVGAAIGNGAAQFAAVAIMWAVAIYLYKVKLPWRLVAKLVFISALASWTAHLFAVRMAPLAGILCGGSAALIVLFVLFYLVRVLEPEDHSRITQLAGMLRRPANGLAGGFLSLLIHREVANDVLANFLGGHAISAPSSAHGERQNRASFQCSPPLTSDKSRGDWGIKISVVIPAYNAERFLPRCLKSIFAQTLKPAEIIVVDDGSTDNTATLAAKLGARVLSKTNSGAADARNYGIKNASGEWIALIDADDLWAPDKLERQIALIRPETVLVYTGNRIFDDGGIYREGAAVDPVAARKMLRYCNSITTSSVILRREAVMQIGGFSKGLYACEDWGLWFRLQSLGQFEAVSEPLTDYYVHPKSLSSNPEVMLQAANVVIDATLTADLQGFERWAWRRRIRAMQLCSAGLIARNNGLKGEIRYLLRSLCAWPSPFWEPRHFAILAISVKNRFWRRSETS
jgi:glycosyltransferase involved in cell wall biosynthesis/O-antigen/teichoic acid export membrane protein